ncbi:MAG: hypothetical protein U0168_13935 [Nannocystaceae bacterium]
MATSSTPTWAATTWRPRSLSPARTLDSGTFEVEFKPISRRQVISFPRPQS